MANGGESVAKNKKARKEDALALAELIYDIYIEDKQKAETPPQESED